MNSSHLKQTLKILLSLCLCAVVHRPGGYQGGPHMLGMGPGGPYNHPPSNSSARMTPQGPSYNTMPTGACLEFSLIYSCDKKYKSCTVFH